MTGRGAQRKGRAGELELVKVLQEMGYHVHRASLPYVDGETAPDLDGLQGVHIEVKRCEGLRPTEWLYQAAADARAGELPAVFFRQNRGTWKVLMNLPEWLKLYERGRET